MGPVPPAGVTWDEIGRAMGITPAYAARICERALAKLRLRKDVKILAALAASRDSEHRCRDYAAEQLDRESWTSLLDSLERTDY